jgi:D-glycero-D-manno-heptose 1,7-bisphosphate phosphatase
MPQKPAVFLDRDGTLNESIVRDGKPYAPDHVKDFHIIEGVPAACKALKDAGFLLVVATNQPEVGRGTVSRGNIEEIHRDLIEKIPQIDRVEVCYDPGRGETSLRRKPAPGMVLDAAKELDINLSRSWMVGDRWRDVDCGKAANVRTIFIDWGYKEDNDAIADYTVKTFQEAARIIIADLQKG